jgi:uncharacterized protein (DUF1697 family)
VSTYLALLRGVNVGGKGMVKMAELKDALSANGLSGVQTYIQSGNVIFSSSTTDTDVLASLIATLIQKKFKLSVDVAVFTKDEWQHIIDAAPTWWGKDQTMKHNLLIMIKPYSMEDVISAIGDLKPEVEAIEPGDGVLYQSMSIKLFGRTSTSKLISNPVYKKMTIRNYNTATKLLSLLR